MGVDLVDKKWDTEIEPVYNGPHGTLTASQFYRRYGNSKLARGEPIGTEYETRTHCGQIIKVDNHGAAYCPICFKVFNSGTPHDKDRATTTTKFKEAGPPPKRLLPRRWANVDRTTSAIP